MLLTLPYQALISGLNPGVVGGEKYNYCIMKTPVSCKYIKRNCKLLMRVSEQVCGGSLNSSSPLVVPEESK